jgi:hypothetical protein
MGCKKTWWRLHLHETEARRDLLAAGAVSQGRALMQGTARVVGLEALMDALSGYMREVLGEAHAGRLSFHTRGEEQFAIRCGSDELAVSGHAALIELLFGTGVDGLPGGIPAGHLCDTLKALLPLTMAQYDMTYS